MVEYFDVVGRRWRGWAGVVGVATTECIANKQLLEAKLSYRHISIQHNAAKQEMQF